MAITVTKPVVGGSQDTWGETLNTALDTIVDGVNGTTGTVSPDLSPLKIDGTSVTATANELNVMYGDTAATSTTVTGTDAIVYNDNGVMKQVTLNDINTFIQAQSGSAGNGTITITGGGALNGSGSFTVNQANNTSITLNHDTSSQGSVNNSGTNFIQDITLDSYGHITGITSADAHSSSANTDWTASGSGSASSSGGGYFTISTGKALQRIIVVKGDDTKGVVLGRTDSSGNFQAQMYSAGNNMTYVYSWVTF